MVISELVVCMCWCVSYVAATSAAEGIVCSLVLHEPTGQQLTRGQRSVSLDTLYRSSQQTVERKRFLGESVQSESQPLWRQDSRFKLDTINHAWLTCSVTCCLCLAADQNQRANRVFVCLNILFSLRYVFFYIYRYIHTWTCFIFSVYTAYNRSVYLLLQYFCVCLCSTFPTYQYTCMWWPVCIDFLYCLRWY